MKQYYLFYISYNYGTKNKLEKAVQQFLGTHDRKLIPAAELESWKKDIIRSIQIINDQNAKCKPVNAEWWTTGFEDEFRDWALHLNGAGNICNAHLYYSQEQ
jgi:hypothetical protein